MTDLTHLSDKELSEAINFHRRQRNLSRGVNEAHHMRQAQMVRLLESEEARRLEEAEKPTYHYYVTHNKGDKNSDWTVTHSKKKPFATARDAADHIMKSGGRRGGTIHTVNAKTGNIVQARSYDSGQAGYARDPGIGDPRHIRDLKEEVEQIDEASKPNQYIEVTNKFTGSKSYHEVHPSKAFAALNHHNSLWNTKSARIVSGKEADAVKSSKMKKEEVELGEDNGPCWDGYRKVGMKMKNGKLVNNCVKEEVELDEANALGWSFKVTTKKHGQHDVTVSRSAAKSVDDAEQYIKKHPMYVKHKPTKIEYVKEEVEQIDEISDDMKKRYVEKGGQDVVDRFTGRGKYEKPRNPANFTKTGRPKKSALNRPEAVKYREKLDNRREIVNKVSQEVHGKKRFGEEVEQIDEISASTLHNYIGKARDDKRAAMKDRTAAEKNVKKYGMASDKKERDDAARRAGNRNQGISVANKKLGTYPADKAKAKVMAREEVELDEAESWEAGYKRRVVKTTSPEHKEKGYNWRIKGKERPEISIKLYKEKPSQEEFNKQMKRVAGHEFGG